MRRTLLLVSYGALVMGGCDDRSSSLDITGARVYRTPERLVAVEVDLLATERLGGNIGMYCTRVTFTGQDTPAEHCNADLEDGDTKTVRLVSERDLADGAAIQVRVRHAAVDVGRTLAVPTGR